MKYTINNNTIDIEYIANGKRKTMKLNNNDETDMNFFKQLVKAKPSNRDAMCDLYQRKILKPTGDNVVRIQPLKLVNEIKQSDYSKKQELQRRKHELQQDKQHIADEAKTLIKDEAKNKDITTLTKTDLKDEADYDKLKEIQARYMEINKVQQMIINQIDNLEINNATNVRIKEIKELNIETFKKLDEYIGKMDISENSKDELVKELTKILGFKEIDDNTLIGVKYLVAAIPQMNTDTAIKIRNFINDNELEDDQSIKVSVLKEVLGKDDFKAIEEPLKNVLLLSLNNVNAFSSNLQNFLDPSFKIYKLLDENLDECVDNLINMFSNDYPEECMTYDEINEKLSKINTKDEFGRLLTEFGYIQNPSNKIKSMMINKQNYTLLILGNDRDFGTNLLANILWEINAKYGYYKSITVKPKKETEYELGVFVIDNTVLKDDEVKQDILKNFCELLSFQETQYNAINLNGVQFYFNYTHQATINKYIMSDVMVKGDIAKFLEIKDSMTSLSKRLDKTKPKQENKEKPVEEISDEMMLLSDGLSGKIMIDLDKSDTNEKLNEIIRLLSQMNYNVFTTTPMYKNNRYKNKTDTKKSKGLDTDSSDDSIDEPNTSKVDLYKIFDL